MASTAAPANAMPVYAFNQAAAKSAAIGGARRSIGGLGHPISERSTQRGSRSPVQSGSGSGRDFGSGSGDGSRSDPGPGPGSGSGPGAGSGTRHDSGSSSGEGSDRGPTAARAQARAATGALTRTRVAGLPPGAETARAGMRRRRAQDRARVRALARARTARGRCPVMRVPWTLVARVPGARHPRRRALVAGPRTCPCGCQSRAEVVDTKK